MMGRHLLKSVWVHRGQSWLVGAEILLSFLILCGVCIAALAFAGRYGTPLGYECENVWHVEIPRDLWEGELREQTLSEVVGFDEAVAAAMASDVPFDDDYDGRFIRTDDGEQLLSRACNATDGLVDVLGLEIVAGRWFDRRDDGVHERPVVVNRALARILFGEEDPVGRDISDWRGRRTYRVVGVMSRFRINELAADEPLLFERSREEGYTASNLLVRVRPGTKPVFGQKILGRLRALSADGGRMEIDPLTRHRKFSLKWQMGVLAGAAIVGALLLAMVALGLVGVLWQSVAGRTHEIGVRRAAGAPARAIYLQFTGEALVITTFAIAIGTGLLVQAFALELVESMGAVSIAAGIGLAVVLLYLMVLASAAFPCHVATRVHPVEALRHE